MRNENPMITTMTEINPFHPRNSNENWKDEFDADGNHTYRLEQFKAMTDERRAKYEAKDVDIRKYNTRLFSVDGIDFTTGTLYNEGGYNVHGFNVDGWHTSGWNEQGINKATGTLYNEDGWDINGFNEAGWANLYGSCLTESEWLQGVSWRKLPTHRDTGTEYDAEGRNLFGFDADGYDRNGFDRIGDYGTHMGYDRAGFNPQGYNKNGYDRQGYNKNGNNRLGFNVDGIHCKTETVWSPDGIHGVTGTGYAPDGYDQNGRDAGGYGRDGFDWRGWDNKGIHKETGTRYNPNGLAESGLNHEGLRPYSGDDTFGYISNEKAPTRVFALSGYNHLVTATKIRTEDTNYQGQAPRNLHREGWRHVAGQGWDAEKAQYMLVDSFTHKDTGTNENPDGFSVIGVSKERMNERGFNIDTKLHTITGTEYDETGWDFFRTTLTTAV